MPILPHRSLSDNFFVLLADPPDVPVCLSTHPDLHPAAVEEMCLLPFRTRLCLCPKSCSSQILQLFALAITSFVFCFLFVSLSTCDFHLHSITHFRKKTPPDRTTLPLPLACSARLVAPRLIQVVVLTAVPLLTCGSPPSLPRLLLCQGFLPTTPPKVLLADHSTVPPAKVSGRFSVLIISHFSAAWCNLPGPLYSVNTHLLSACYMPGTVLFLGTHQRSKETKIPSL